MRSAMATGWTLMLAALVCLAAASPSRALEEVQTDWLAGEGAPGPVNSWGQAFDTSDGVSWRSVPGQLSLGSVPLAAPVPHVLASGLPVAFGVHPVDIDRDGDMDVLGAAGEAQFIALWINDGQFPPGWTAQIIDSTFAGAAGVHAADIDGDQDMDVIASAENPGNRLAWWRNDGGSPIVWSRQVLDNAFAVSCSITSTDINQDGRPDVLATSWTLGDVCWWRNEGGDPVTWTRLMIDGNFSGAHDAQAFDLDADGDLDVVGAAGTLNQVAWWRNNGGDPITWQRFPIQTAFSGARAIHVADIDRDGRLDVAGVAWSNHLTWWRNEGGNPPAWTRYDVDSALTGGHGVWTGDIDGDGWVDLMATGYNANKVSWWRNSGTQPISWTEHNLATGWENPMNVRAGDLDGNGDLEILASSRLLGAFAYWEAASFRDSGTLQSSILDLHSAPESTWIGWTLRQPEATSLELRLRSSNDAGDLGLWSAPIPEPGDPGIDLGRYLQYKLELNTTDPEVSPIFEEIRFFAVSPTAVPDSPGDARGPALKTIGLPGGEPVLRLSLPESCHIRIDLFAPSGRRLMTAAEGAYSRGVHEIPVRGLPSGVVLCRMSAGGVVVTERLTVLR